MGSAGLSHEAIFSTCDCVCVGGDAAHRWRVGETVVVVVVIVRVALSLSLSLSLAVTFSTHSSGNE